MIIDRLAHDIMNDDYFRYLFLKASVLIPDRLFHANLINFSQKEFIDLLKFSDILSNSLIPEARNKSYQIISLLNTLYKSDLYYKTYSHSVLTNLGNFPAIEYLETKDNNKVELPFKKRLEKNIKEIFQKVPFSKDLVFTDAQFVLFKQIENSKYFSFSGPTSVGKSFLIKSFIRNIISKENSKNIIILVPTRALISQFTLDIKTELKSNISKNKYKVLTNSNASEIDTNLNQQYIFVLTPERLISFLSRPSSPIVGFIFVDEAHKIASEEDVRSLTTYNAIELLLKKNPEVSIFFSSPNITNPEVFLKLFNINSKNFIAIREAAVSQNLFFIDLIEKNVKYYVDGTAHNIKSGIEIEDSSKLIKFLGKGQSNIIYCSSIKQSIEQSLHFFGNASDDFIITPSIRRVMRHISTHIHEDYFLSELLSKGIAYHFSNIPQVIKSKIETLFKQGEITYLFCTSTLLEGVNLPAKNVFILNDKKGNKKLEKIDFWNLAGRAGRLKIELAGNIFCIREGLDDWKNKDLFEKSKEIKISPTIESCIDKKIKKIEKVLKNEEIKNETNTGKEMIRYVANLIDINSLEIDSTYENAIVRKLLEKKKIEILEIAKKKNENIEIPLQILKAHASINVNLQDELYKHLKNETNRRINVKLPLRVSYDNCLLWLTKFHEMYKWEKTEKLLHRENSLKYFAMLMNKWINGIPLNLIILQSIDFYTQNKRTIRLDFENDVPFNNRNKEHVNYLIGKVINDIENVLRFTLEKYFNNYYSIITSIYGENNSGVNWSLFLEYGSNEALIIELQNLGLSRHSAFYIYEKHNNCLKVQNNKIQNINIEKLKNEINRDDVEFDEINSILL